MPEYHWVYILECENAAYYTGYTHDLEARYKAHLDKTSGCKYTRSFKPVKLAQAWHLEANKSIALKIEALIKTQTKAEKVLLVQHPERLNALAFEKLNLNLKVLKNVS